MFQRIKQLVQSPYFILLIYSIAAIFISVQQHSLGPKSDTGSHINNYLIFKYSFFHLIHSQNLYTLYPDEHWDYYKYSPSFALLMAPLAWLPDLPGLIAWNLLNALTLFFAIRWLPVSDKKIKVAVWWFVVVELITALQNSQSNALIAGLLILSFCFLERRQIIWGTLMISLTVFIKIFGLVAFSLFFLYTDRRKFFLYSATWMIILVALPLVVVSPHELSWQYHSWKTLLSMDYGGSLGLSVMGWLHTWFHFDPPKNVVTIFGIILFCVPLLFVKRFSEAIFRWLFLCNILIWIIIFNHKAESPTFIIAASGIALWYFGQERTNLNLVLVILAFIFTCLSPTDLFPHSIRNNFFVPYSIKAVPCILIWGKIIYELISGNYKPKPSLA